jgi:hypothetical protein
MPVRAEPLARRDAVVVEHAERAKAHMAWIEVAAERKRVVAAEPTEVAVAAVFCFSKYEH